MRGIPNQPVTCAQCGAEWGCAKDGLCHGCRVATVARQRRRHTWTPEFDQALRRSYQTAHNRAALIDGITAIQRLTRFPRSVIVSRAAALGLTRPGRRWNEQEISQLQEILGSRSLSTIAGELGRSYYSVKGAVARLQVSARQTEGYSRQDLERLLGVSSRQVRRWIALKWIKLVDERVPESEIARFLRRHPEQYQLNRVDEAWFKGLLFPAFNTFKVEKVRGEEPLPVHYLRENWDSRRQDGGVSPQLAPESV
jgi:primosomal protein N'